MPDDCEPCGPSKDRDNSNPAGITNPNTPVGGVDFTIPAPIPETAPGPEDSDATIDMSPPNYAGGFPSVDVSKYDYLCDTIPTINMIQGLIMSMIAHHFSDARNIINPTLRQYTWDPDVTQTNIIINIEEDWDPQITDRRPAVYLTRKAMKVMKLSINDEMQGGRNDGKQHFAVVVEGSHDLIVRGKGGSMTDSLAEEVAFLLVRITPLIRVWLKLVQLRVTDVSDKVREEGDPQDAYEARVSVPWAYLYHWETTPSAAVLEFINLQYFF
jgi:hypothetical protein